MIKRASVLSLLMVLLLSARAFAVSVPSVAPIPDTIDAEFYAITVYVETGAKVTVVGGPSFIAPVTDGVGNELDGEVEVLVGLAQGEPNVFGITAELEGEISDALEITINESGSISSGPPRPNPAVLDSIPNPIESSEYSITGSAGANAQIVARNTAGETVGTATVGANGRFSVLIPLEANKTNRINVHVKNEGAESAAVQAVIQAVFVDEAPEPEEAEEKPKIPESKQETAVFFPFNDVEGHWGKDYIKTIYERGIVSGKTATTFEPNANITRAELTKIAIEAFGYDPVDSLNERPFADVSITDWFAKYVEKAKILNLIQGFDDGFHPNDPITRAAALKILLEASGLDLGAGGTAGFSDVPADAWFELYVSFARQNDIVSGYADGTFGPGRRITRAQVAKIVSSILEIKEVQ